MSRAASDIDALCSPAGFSCRTSSYRSSSRASLVFAQVAVLAGGSHLERVFTYRLNDDQPAQVGQCVTVPFHGRTELGYVLSITSTPEIDRDLLVSSHQGAAGPTEWKSILEVLDTPPVFDRATASLFAWMARQYACSLADAVRCVVPSSRLAAIRTLVRLPDDLPIDGQALSPLASRIVEELNARGGEVALEELQMAIRVPRLTDAIRRLARRGKLELVRTTETPSEGRTVLAVRLAAALDVESWLDAHGRRRPRQKEIVELLARSGAQPIPQAEVLRALSCSASSIDALVTGGAVVREMLAVRRSPWPSEAQIPLRLGLTDDQQGAFETIRCALDEALARPVPQPGAPALAPPVVLLRGVTGSGKTEVYLRAIEAAVLRGRQAITLVPEISLTAQMVGIFHARFGTRVAVLHSALGAGERLDEWQRIRRGEVDVVIGARSALFAPVPALGLVVLDEEHESSYKQDSAPRYLARDAAIERARLTGSCVVLASATPSLESAWMVERGAWSLATLPVRIDDRPLPAVTIVDQRIELKENPGHLFSRRLVQAIGDRLAQQQQIILFLNRRGFATVTLCRDCGYVARCPHCAVSLTYYAARRLLRCHHCDFQSAAPDVCPNCEGTRIRQFGVGTERVEKEVSEIFPHARMARLDAESTTRKGSAQLIIGRFARGDLDILVGTQMVAKGFDFPGVTLVGVVSADTMLNLPDFRAAERSFQLLTQVSGRAGRGPHPGEVVVQTFNPEHYAVRAASRHSFDTFFEQELPTRREARYPPFVRLASWIVEGETYARARGRAEWLAGLLRREIGSNEIELLGPAPAPLVRLRGRYRWHILLKADDPALLQSVCLAVRAAIPSPVLREVTVDLDPLSLL